MEKKHCPDILILCWGGSGLGKSAFVNYHADSKIAVEGPSSESCTMKCTKYDIEHHRFAGLFRTLSILDTRGLNCTHGTNEQVAMTLSDFLLRQPAEPLITKFDAMLFFHLVQDIKVARVEQSIKEFNATFKANIDVRSRIILLNKSGEILPKKLMEKRKSLAAALPQETLVFWDNQDPIEDQDENLGRALSHCQPFVLEGMASLSGAILARSEVLRKSDLVLIYQVKSATGVKVLSAESAKTVEYSVEMSKRIVHTEHVSDTGWGTILTLGISKLLPDYTETEWFKIEVEFPCDACTKSLSVIELTQTPLTTGGHVISAQHSITGSTISLRSELSVHQTQFGHFSVAYDLKYRLSGQRTTGYKPAEGETIEEARVPRYKTAEHYYAEARMQVLSDYHRAMKQHH